MSSAKRERLKVAAISMTSGPDKAANVEVACREVEAAAKAGAEWVQLPEMFHFMGPYEQIYAMAEEEGGPLYTRLSRLAKTLGIVLIAGTLGERPPASVAAKDLIGEAGHKRVHNTCWIFGRSGELLARYRKTHLFNLHDETGKAVYCESDGFLPGDDVVTVDIDGWRVGMSVCYDLRFPAFYGALAAKGALDVILVPSAFTKATGQAHWELLLRARAVEWQAYVFAANQVGTHAPGKESYGHALVVDPWGTVIADSGDRPGIAMADIAKAEVAAARRRLPALANRRPELY
jgi:predicted amidohydrolase